MIVDEEACRAAGRFPLALAEAAIAGGAAVIQLRAKAASDSDYMTLAAPIAKHCRAASVPFIVNDRVHLVHELDADGVHVGQGDMPIASVRAHVGDRLVGVSTHNPAQAQAAERVGADWIALGPIFQTRSKANPDPEVGLEGLREVCTTVKRPVIAIGGIDTPRAPQVLSQGAAMIAVISVVCQSPDPEGTTRALAALF